MRVSLLYCITLYLCVNHALGAKLGDKESLQKRIADRDGLICFEDTDSDVRLKPEVVIPDLGDVTFCFWMKSTTENDGTMVSYAVPGTDNEMILYDYGHLKLLINAQFRSTSSVAINDGVCHYICFTWASMTGRWEIFVDGVSVGSGTVSQGTPIQGGGTLVLGQDQDVVGGGFAANQAFVGQMAKFNLWNRVLTNQEIIDKLDYGNVYSWDFSTLLMQGTEKKKLVDICSGSVECDPHFTTLDGRHYSHQGLCWHTLVKDCSNPKPDFEITADFEPRESGPDGEIRTRVVALNVTVGDEYVEVDRLEVKRPKGVHSKIQIAQTDEHVLLTFKLKDTTFTVDWTLRRHIFSIEIDGIAYYDKLCGLLGNYNGDTHDDFQKPDGTIAHDAVEFGDSWKVPGIKCE